MDKTRNRIIRIATDFYEAFGQKRQTYGMFWYLQKGVKNCEYWLCKRTKRRVCVSEYDKNYRVWVEEDHPMNKTVEPIVEFNTRDKHYDTFIHTLTEAVCIAEKRGTNHV